MKILSFDNRYNKIKRDSEQSELYNLFEKNIVNNQSLNLKIFIVPREYEMRLDKISEHIYGSPDYVEELMVLNDIINPFSIKEGQYIYFCQSNNLENLYTQDETSKQSDKVRNTLIQINQPNIEKTNINNDNQKIQTNIKPTNLNQVKVTKDHKIKIVNSFE